MHTHGKKRERVGIGVQRERWGRGEEEAAGGEAAGGWHPREWPCAASVGWLAEKARDKAVVVAAGWVDLYVAGVEGARESLAAAASATTATAAATRSERRLVR